MKKNKEFFSWVNIIPWERTCRIMKVLFILLTASLVSFASGSYSQSKSLSFRLEQANLLEVFQQIEKQSDMLVAYDVSNIDTEQRINIAVDNASIENVLNKALGNTDLTYKIMNRYIIISRNENEPSSVSQQQKSLSGSVTDSSGAPLPGVTVVIKGKATGTITDANGNFSLANVPTDATVKFSFIGMKAQEVSVAGKSSINIIMTEESIGIGEVVAIGYGTIKKVNLTGSVATVSGNDLMKVSGSGASTAFAGRMPGVMVTQTDGAPGSGASIKIRGIGSLNSNNDPLVLIDGFAGSLDGVPPADIESISVLKDAASAAIYGSRAANGVILVTTKKGKKDQPFKVEVTARTGVQQATHLPAILNTREWINKSNETVTGAGGNALWVTGDPKTDPSLQTTNFNWMDYVFRSAPVSDVNASMNGGTSKLRYSANVGYFDQQGIVIGEGFKRASIRTSIDYITDKFSTGVTMSQFKTWSNSNINRSYLFQDIFRTPPTIAANNPDGTISGARPGYDGENILDYTPAMDAAMRDYSGGSNSSAANLYAEVQLLKGLKLKTVLNTGSYSFSDGTFLNVWKSFAPDGTPGKGNATAQYINSENTSWSWESQNLLTYTLSIKDHHVDVLLGASAQKSTYSGFNATKSGYLRNELHALDAGSTLVSAGGSEGKSSMASQFGRLNYSYKSKYLFEANVRRDGSSVFAPGHQWGVFPSASAGWRVSEENFIKTVPAISNLKLSAGYGSLGNQGINPNLWLGLLNFQKYVFNNTVVSTAQLNSMYNENISWEKTTELNMRMDLGLLNNKLNFTAEVFNRKTTDMLLEVPVPLTMGGVGNPYDNVGAVNNKGWEFSADYNDRAGEFRYGVSFNISHVKNEVTQLVETVKTIDQTYNNNVYTRTEVGQALRSYYGYVVDGIWQNASEIANSGYTIKVGGSKPGDFRYKDLNNDKIIDNKDRTFLGNSFPQYYYGGNLFLQWKGIDCNMLLQGVFKRKIYVSPEYGMDLGRYSYANIYKEFYDQTWKQDGDGSKYPQLGHSADNNLINSTWVQDASYMRIKNLEVGYTLPKAFVSKLNLQQLRVFANATNLLTLTKYIGFDPEMDRNITYGGADYPQAKTFSLGVNVTF